jgi:hypothetical protein
MDMGNIFCYFFVALWKKHFDLARLYLLCFFLTIQNLILSRWNPTQVSYLLYKRRGSREAFASQSECSLKLRTNMGQTSCCLIATSTSSCLTSFVHARGLHCWPRILALGAPAAPLFSHFTLRTSALLDYTLPAKYPLLTLSMLMHK